MSGKRQGLVFGHRPPVQHAFGAPVCLAGGTASGSGAFVPATGGGSPARKTPPTVVKPSLWSSTGSLSRKLCATTAPLQPRVLGLCTWDLDGDRGLGQVVAPPRSDADRSGGAQADGFHGCGFGTNAPVRQSPRAASEGRLQKHPHELGTQGSLFRSPVTMAAAGATKGRGGSRGGSAAGTRHPDSGGDDETPRQATPSSMIPTTVRRAIAQGSFSRTGSGGLLKGGFSEAWGAPEAAEPALSCGRHLIRCALSASPCAPADLLLSVSLPTPPGSANADAEATMEVAHGQRCHRPLRSPASQGVDASAGRCSRGDGRRPRRVQFDSNCKAAPPTTIMSLCRTSTLIPPSVRRASREADGGDLGCAGGARLRPASPKPARADSKCSTWSVSTLEAPRSQSPSGRRPSKTLAWAAGVALDATVRQ